MAYASICISRSVNVGAVLAAWAVASLPVSDMVGADGVGRERKVSGLKVLRNQK
jgi:hypothetical protein